MAGKGGFEKNPQNINRNGRPKKGQTMTDILKTELDGLDLSTADGKLQTKHAIAKKMIEVAMTGDTTALKYIFDRIDGSPRQSVEHTGEDGEEILIKVVTSATD